MKEPRIIKYSDVKVIMRKDFYDNFGDQLNKISKETGASYFGHNLIRNYREKGHKVSTFCNYEDWHDIYWEQFCYHDPLEQVIHSAVQKNDFGVISWEMGHNSSSCHQKRTLLTAVKDGVTFSFKRPDNYIETLAIGWKNLDADKLDTDYIFHLTALLKPIRDYHWDVHDKV